MKNLNIILFGLIVLLASCTSSVELGLELEENIKYEGVYNGKFNCEGTMEFMNGSDFTVVITKKLDNTYAVDFGDEVIFEGSVLNNQLIVERQTINQEEEFDAVTMEIDMSLINVNTYALELYHKVGEEGPSNCSITMIKQ